MATAYKHVTKDGLQDSGRRLMRDLGCRSNETVEYMYHASTKPTSNFDELCGFPTSRPEWSILARNRNIKGVWFCVTKSAFGHKVPDRSPYGPYQVLIPCSEIIEGMQQAELFLESCYYFDAANAGKQYVNQYVRVVLVDAGQFPLEYEWCRRNLVSLDLRQNDIFQYDKESGMTHCIENRVGVNPDYWVEVLVVGDVPYYEGTMHRNVTSSYRATYGATFGLCEYE